MDLLNLLEVLKPLDHVVSIKVFNDAGVWDSASKVAIAIIPALISFLALLFSYFQFKSNIRYQSQQFSIGIEQQLKALKLNTRLATEIELKKDVCKEVRAAFVSFMKHHSQQYSAKNEYESIKNNNDDLSYKRCKVLHEKIMASAQSIMEGKFLLDSYLDLNEPDAKELNDALNEITTISITGGDGTGADLGRAQAICSSKCFHFIERRRKEIASLVDTIGN